ncbi:zinc finger, C3HC4 type (RING finger) protein (macronuclear) [Tetrahymena thermophila SB210]|uniref:Zinc finger, C3HC4 type (RING finger) protein n=1 Tax=Tetrahymena thermophila (strain SB210) TaxID=312017 RepID=A4VDB8_TETTS|nr:zinc finger, C3HC4 type (RING finger) protein [Tetrahymena thermophila SB210]EDK31529.2 zinc finger, C3HC4 type (RING finger) protein [Tetrahymena thermophila SB210]|eukprot:XP_001470909.2 zinc finger, C3HC4 type (RING finger) protein [Tetrahymena thermophila SB210]
MKEIKSVFLMLVFFHFILTASEIRQLQSQDVNEIDEQTPISFQQIDQQSSFVYKVKSQKYIMVSLILKSQVIQNSSYKVEMCSTKNNSVLVKSNDSNYLLSVSADQCDTQSYQQNSLNHYLFYQPQQISVGDQIYISVIMSRALNSLVYTLQLETSDQQMCPQQCSNQGSCLTSCQCQCNPGYFKNDCSVQAPQLKLNNVWKGYIQFQQTQYLSINFNDASFKQEQLSMVQINFQKESNSKVRLLDTSPSSSNGPEYLIISYIFVNKQGNQIPSLTNSDSTQYMITNEYSLNFVSQQIQSLADKNHLVISIYSNYTSTSYISVEVVNQQNQEDDSLKTKIFIFFFSGFGVIVLLWLMLLVYRAYKRRQLERSRFQQALESIVNRRTNRVSPSKLTLSNDMVEKYMPIRIYKDILERLKHPYKNLACELLLAQQFQKQIQQEQMESQKFGKEMSLKTIQQNQHQQIDQERNDISTLQNKRTNNDVSILNENQQDQTNAFINQQNFENAYQDQNEINLFRNNSNNFENSVQFNQANVESFQDEDEIQCENQEDGGLSKDIECQQNQENQVQQQQNPIQEEQCSVCLIEFQESDQIRITICDHIFHSECLLQWLKSQENCPNCRKDLQRRKLKYWYSIQVRKQLRIMMNDRSAYSINLFLGQPKSKSTTFGEQVAESNQQQQFYRKTPMFPFNKVKQLKRFNSLQGEFYHNSQTQGNILNNGQKTETDNIQQTNQLGQNNSKSIQRPTQVEYQEVSFNGAIVRIPKPKIETNTQKVIEVENEEEEEKKEQLEEQNQDICIQQIQNEQIIEQNSKIKNDSLSIQQENKSDLNQNGSNKHIDLKQNDNQNMFECISLNNSIQIEDCQQENSQCFRKRKHLRESWFKKSEQSKQILNIEEDNSSMKTIEKDNFNQKIEEQQIAGDYKSIRKDSLNQENIKQNISDDESIINLNINQTNNQIKNHIEIKTKQIDLQNQQQQKNVNLDLSETSKNKQNDINHSIKESNKSMNENNFGQKLKQSDDQFNCELIDLENRQESPCKIDSITQKLELNEDFDPSIFRLQTEDLTKSNQIKQVNKCKEKSHTAIRNNKKIIQQDTTPSKRTKQTKQTKQLNLNSLSSKDTNPSPKLFITPQKNSFNNHQIQKYQPCSSPILLQNASSILNNKIKTQNETLVSQQEHKIFLKSQIRNSQEIKS